jgi:hypothetical protein
VKFHLGDVLSITTGHLVSPRGVDALYAILNYMTGDNLYTHQLPRAAQECRPHLIKQFPPLDSPEMAAELEHLKAMLQTPSGQENPMELCLGWTSGVAGKLGLEMELFVLPLPRYAHEFKDPMRELEEMVPPEKILAIQIGDSEEEHDG